MPAKITDRARPRACGGTSATPSATATLCSSATGVSGGTFTCSAPLKLGVPASAGAGTYTGTIVLTLA
jgi:hypothetical protein